MNILNLEKGLISKKINNPKYIRANVIRMLKNIPPNTEIHVKVMDRVYVGKFRLELRDPSRINPTDSLLLFKLNEPSPPLCFKISEIDEVRSVAPRYKWNKREPKSNAGKLGPNEPVELLFSTFRVSLNEELKAFVELVKDFDVTGIVFNGENVGRNGKVSWIIFAMAKTLIPLDIIALQKNTPKLWEILGRRVFANPRLLKIIHNARPAFDYLHHVHNLAMVNVFDTQANDALIVRSSTGEVPEYLRPLSDCLITYNHRIPDFEIEIMRSFEQSSEFQTNSPWLTSNLDSRIMKYGALQVKHLIPLHQNQLKKLLTKSTLLVEEIMNSVTAPDVLHLEEEYPMKLPSAMAKIILNDVTPDPDIGNFDFRNNNINDIKSSRRRSILLIPNGTSDVDC